MTPRKPTAVEAFLQPILEPNMLWFEQLWPKDLHAFEPDRFEGQVKRAVHRNHELLRCDPQSMLDALLRACELGLDPSWTGKRAKLVAAGTRVKLELGCLGLTDLALRSGAVKSIGAWVISQGDGFTWLVGSVPRHQPVWADSEEKQPTGAWALAVLPNGAKQVDVLPATEFPWRAAAHTVLPEGELSDLYRKAVLLRLLGSIPLGASRTRGLAKALEMEEGVDEAPKQLVESTAEPKRSNGAAGISAKLGLED